MLTPADAVKAGDTAEYLRSADHVTDRPERPPTTAAGLSAAQALQPIRLLFGQPHPHNGSPIQPYRVAPPTVVPLTFLGDPV
ncbi:hypothetical protein SAMN04489726_7298 [Allokutzneria albata]|uniref:Uncharacterized protein n=1 Tax=Allokutzneria albata TaxID=211114 RepID=A0A1H0CLL4_ALLAB|nr:hypothetical protein SAMN04489726_7298 [Allokutzneria albata]